MNRRSWGVLALGLAAYVPAQQATATAIITTTTIGWGRVPGVCLRGAAGTPYTLQWTRGGVPTGTVTVTPATLAPVYVKAPAGTVKGDVVRVTTKVGSNVTYAALFNPPENFATVTHAVAEGSVATFGGEQYALGGSFSAIADTFAGDTLGGAVQQSGFAITGASTSSANTLAISLTGDQPFAVDYSGLTSLAAGDSIEGRSVSFSFPLSGLVTLNGSTSVAFTGSVMGTASYDPSVSGAESYAAQFVLNTQFGAVLGELRSSGVVAVVPAPATPLAALGLTLLAVRRRRGAAA